MTGLPGRQGEQSSDSGDGARRFLEWSAATSPVRRQRLHPSIRPSPARCSWALTS